MFLERQLFRLSKGNILLIKGSQLGKNNNYENFYWMLSINQSIQSTKKDDLVFHGKPSGAYFNKLEKSTKTHIYQRKLFSTKKPWKNWRHKHSTYAVLTKIKSIWTINGWILARRIIISSLLRWREHGGWHVDHISWTQASLLFF